MQNTTLALEGQTLVVKNATIVNRNFSGNPTKVNPAGGVYTFTLKCIYDDYIQSLMDLGIPFKKSEPSPDGSIIVYLQIKVKYQEGTKIGLHNASSDTHTLIKDANMATVLDDVLIDYVDMAARMYRWTQPGSSGVSMWLNELHLWMRPSQISSLYDTINYGTNGGVEYEPEQPTEVE